MAEFTLDEVVGSASAPAKVREAWVYAELAIRSTDHGGGQALERKLERASEGARRALRELRALGQRAIDTHAGETVFDFALISAGLSPDGHHNPFRNG